MIPQFVMQDQGISTLRDTLRNVPGISLAAGESGAQGDNLTIRGFTARNDIFLDGIRDFGSYYRDSFNYEQVEALEGPAGIQFGRGSTGGVINQESKSPVMQKFVNVQAQFGTDKTRRITADINAPMTGCVGRDRGPRERDGTGRRSGGRDVCGDSAVWDCAFDFDWAGYTDTGYVELRPPDGERYSGLWPAVVLEHGGSGADSA